MPLTSHDQFLSRSSWRGGVCATGWAVVLALSAVAALAQPTGTAPAERCLTIEIYIRGQTPQEQDLAARAEQILKERRGVIVVRHDVAADSAARDRLQRLVSHFKLPESSGPVIYGLGQAIVANSSDAALRSQLNSLRRMDVYYREGCPHCHAARQFLPQLQRRYPGLEIAYHDAVGDQSAIRELQALSQRYRQGAATLPVFHFCGKLIVGFDRAETTGARLQQTIEPWTAAFPAAAVKPAPAAPRAPPSASPSPTGPPAPSNGPPMARATIMPRKLYRGRIVLAALPADAAHILRTPRAAPTPRTAALRTSSATHTARVIRVAQAREIATPAEPRPSASDESSSSEPSAPGHADPAAAADPSSTAELPIPPEEAQSNPLPLPEPPAGTEGLPLPDAGADTLDGPNPFSSVEDEGVDLPLFGTITVRQLGMPLFTLAIGLVDGFNPCAMWVLVFLLSILVNLQSRWKILAVAGTFVFISGAAYFAFMAAWLNVFLWVGYLRSVQVALAVLAIFVGSVHVKDFFAFHRGLTLSIPESAKPGIYARVRRIVTAENLTGAILGASVLAVLVNIVELLCTAGLPALYTQILSGHQFPWWKNYGYLLLYNLAYMFDDTLMVAGVVCTLRKTRLQETQGRWLKLVSGTVILALGIVMLLRPEWLM